MKTRQIITVGFALALLPALDVPLATALAQGTLAPSGPPGPTMKTLAQIEPRTPIGSLPFTITNAGSYYLTTNLTGVSGASGITIASGDVTLDLSGFALTGVPGSVDGIAIPALYTNLTVRNGTVRGWGGTGVEVYNGENEVLEHLAVSDAAGGYGIDAYGAVVRDCTVDNCGTNAGIYIASGVLRNCAVIKGSGSGIVADSGSKVVDCTANQALYDGIDAYDSEVRDCVAENNGSVGIYVAPGSVLGCQVETNGYSGIYADAPGCQIRDNTCLGNNSNVGTGDAGIYINDSNNRIEANHVIGSGHAGIEISASGSTNNVVVKNSVSGNGASNYVIPAGQLAGPLITGAGTITNSNPWANFSR